MFRHLAFAFTLLATTSTASADVGPPACLDAPDGLCCRVGASYGVSLFDRCRQLLNCCHAACKSNGCGLGSVAASEGPTFVSLLHEIEIAVAFDLCHGIETPQGREVQRR